MPVTTKKRPAKKKAAVEVAELTIEGLTPKETLFVAYYVGEANLNAAKACKLAGYKDGNAIYAQANQNLRKPAIRQAIHQRLNGAAMAASEVLMRLSRHAEADIGDLLDEDGGLDFATARERGLTDLIKEIDVKERWVPTGDDGPPEKERTFKLKLHDSQAALDKLGRYHKLFTDKTELTGKDGGAIAVVDVEQAIAGCMAEMIEAQRKNPQPTDEPITREVVVRYLAPFIPGIK
jgi:phage terminase small subunit